MAPLAIKASRVWDGNMPDIKVSFMAATVTDEEDSGKAWVVLPPRI
jgi:hypothetical protein